MKGRRPTKSLLPRVRKAQEAGLLDEVYQIKFKVARREDARRHSVVPIDALTKHVADPVLYQASVKGTVKDMRMGFDLSEMRPRDSNGNPVNFVCETCGRRPFECPGHVGSMNLGSEFFNPFFVETIRKVRPSAANYLEHVRFIFFF